FFNTERGYGFIAPDGGGSDVFVHIHEVEAAGMKMFVARQLVAWHTRSAPRGMGAQKSSICDRLRPDLQGTGAAERLHRMDFAPAPARGKGGRRADQCGDGWNADGAPTEADHKTVGLSKKNPITNRVAIPGRPLSLYSGVISPSIKSQSILPASCASSGLMLMIWSSRARNRSPDPLVSCCFGRIAPHR